MHVLNGLWVIAFGSENLDIYQVLDAMSQRGWNLNGLHKPAAVHLCVTLRHTQPGVAQRFVDDLQAAVDQVRQRRRIQARWRPVTAWPRHCPFGASSKTCSRHTSIGSTASDAARARPARSQAAKSAGTFPSRGFEPMLLPMGRTGLGSGHQARHEPWVRWSCVHRGRRGAEVGLSRPSVRFCHRAGQFKSLGLRKLLITVIHERIHQMSAGYCLLCDPLHAADRRSAVSSANKADAAFGLFGHCSCGAARGGTVGGPDLICTEAIGPATAARLVWLWLARW